MTRTHQLATAAVVLMLTACAHEAVAPSAPAPSSATSKPVKDRKSAPEPEFKKPVNMNNRGKVTSISMDQVFELQQSGKAMIFDARPAFFYNLSHIPGAISLPKNNCDAVIHAKEAEIKAALAEGKTLIVYCTNLMCPDARTVATHLSGFGYAASVFHGGWEGWQEAGMPTE
jgi:rhodanese-related sulfurtransferase